MRDDETHCRLAILEARRCKAEDRPGGGVPPKVGAVAVSHTGKILGKAYRGQDPKKPGDHAEFMLLRGLLRGETMHATIYTTLEPCVRRGTTKDGTPKTPCADRLIEAGVGRVVIGMLDPNPDITGRGVMRLRRAGIEVSLFPSGWQELAERVNEDFSAQYQPVQGLHMSDVLNELLATTAKGVTALHSAMTQAFLLGSITTSVTKEAARAQSLEELRKSLMVLNDGGFKNEIATLLAGMEVSHGRQCSAVREIMEKLKGMGRLDEEAKVLAQFALSRPLPGKK